MTSQERLGLRNSAQPLYSPKILNYQSSPNLGTVSQDPGLDQNSSPWGAPRSLNATVWGFVCVTHDLGKVRVHDARARRGRAACISAARDRADAHPRPCARACRQPIAGTGVIDECIDDVPRSPRTGHLLCRRFLQISRTCHRGRVLCRLASQESSRMAGPFPGMVDRLGRWLGAA